MNESKKGLKSWLCSMKDSHLLMILSIVVGISCGLAASFLKLAIKYIHQWVINLPVDTNISLLLLPGLGMLLTMLYVKFCVKDDIGHGVTKVLVAVSKNESKIKPHNTYSSMIASSITIGFGGSVGAEAPIVYTGAAIGSNVARWLDRSYKDMTILLGCGAAGAVAGIFNAPLAGVLFTLEILLFNISMSSILPLLLSTVSATVVTTLILGNALPFTCTLEPFAMRNLLFYIILAVFCAFFSIYFTQMTLFLEDKIKGIRGSIKRWVFSAIFLGLLIFLFPPLYGEGYDSLNVFLSGGQPLQESDWALSFMMGNKWLVVVFFTLVLFFKVFSMSLTNAGGGVGGTFGPTLFVGAIAGFVVSRLINIILTGTGISVPEQNFVLVGMAGMMAGVMQAPMTAIFLIAEVSGGYSLLLPLILTSAISFGVSRSFEPYSIYTKRIAKTGELLTHDNDKAVLTLLKISSLIRDKYPRVNMNSTLGELVGVISESQAAVFPVLDKTGRFRGLLDMDNVRKFVFKTELYDKLKVKDFMEQPQDYVYDDESMESVMNKFDDTGAWRLPVVDSNGKYLGFVSKSRILSAYREELKIISHD